MDTDRVTTVRRALLAVTVLAAAWAALVALTGGFTGSVAGVRVSSRTLRNPLLLAVISAAAAVALSWSNRGALRDDLRRLAWVMPLVAAVAGATLLIVDWARARPLWLDEEMIALNVRDRTAAEFAGPLWLDQIAPLGWLMTERAVLLLFGQSEIALRALPVAFAIAMLGAAVWIGHRWMGPISATALVLLLSLGRWVYYYSLELKHYSADMFFGLLLPALVVWAVEGDGLEMRRRRAVVWACAAAIGLWWGIGALLVTPACALLLAVRLWRLHGRRSAATLALFGLPWVLSAMLHYVAALRFALSNEVLREVWSFAFPPSSADIIERLTWVVGQAAPFAARPGGTGLTMVFWAAAVGGVVLGRPRMLAWSAAAVVVSAAALAVTGIVPLYERFSLWTVPALYLGIALCLEATIRWASEAPPTRRMVAAACAAVVALGVLYLVRDVASGGWREVVDEPRRSSNHQLDDRTGVRWLLAQRQRDDAVLTTTLALPAVWWYGDVSMRAPVAGKALPDGIPIYGVSYQPPGPVCDRGALAHALAPHRRVLVYFGFRFDDVPTGFDELLVSELQKIGRISTFQSFAGVTRAAVVELNTVPQPAAAPSAVVPARLDGCVSVNAAARW